MSNKKQLFIAKNDMIFYSHHFQLYLKKTRLTRDLPREYIKLLEKFQEARDFYYGNGAK